MSSIASRKVFLNALPDGATGVVQRLATESGVLDQGALRRLGDIGFIPGEPVRVIRRGPGGREPLAVVIGQTMFALRLVEAQCIEVTAD